jgi:hypothetical protein
MPMQQQHFDVVSPPLSGRSTPKAHVPNVMARGQDNSAYNMHKYHTVSYLKHFFFVIEIIYSVLFFFSLSKHKVFFVSFTVIFCSKEMCHIALFFNTGNKVFKSF